MWALIDHYPLRVATASLCYAVQIGLLLAALRPMAKNLGPDAGVLLLGLGLGVQMMVLLLRAAMALSIGTAASVRAAGQRLGAEPDLPDVVPHGAAGIAGLRFHDRDRLDEGNRRLATTDALTGVANRRSVISRWARCHLRQPEPGGSVALMVVDIDHFKAHQRRAPPGGRPRAVPRRQCPELTACAAQDLVGRYGGEEFLVLLPDTGLDGALVLAEQRARACSSRCATGRARPWPSR